MRFWDASAIVPLIVGEEGTAGVQRLALADPAMTVWWSTELECVSALARQLRDGGLTEEAAAQSFDRLAQLAGVWDEVDPTDALREAARRFLRVHSLRTAGALQLAAAFVVAERRPSTLDLVTLDDRLADAARKEGFRVLPVQA